MAVADAREAGAQDPPERAAVSANALSRLEVWGYAVWGLTAVVVAVPEIWALAGSPRWPTVSATAARLEELWSPTKAIVVALVTAVLVQLITYPPTRSEYRLSGERLRWRTKAGRLTKAH